jgi:hypothetical protein
MTNPEYNRGYNRGVASVNPKLAEYRNAVEQASERARRAEAGVCGPCRLCARWTRGSPGHPHWGYCDFPKVVGIGDDNWWGQPDHKVCTQENFGCVRFLQQTPGA